MFGDIQLNVPLLRRRVPNLTVASRAIGLRPATVSNLCTGKIPLARAEVRTLVALASLAGCSLDELVLRGAGAGMVETGIKVLDLLAPVVRGGTVGLVSRPGLGQMVVLAEVLHRLGRRGFAPVVWSPGEPHPHMADAIAQARAMVSTVAEVERIITDLRADSDVVVAADRAVVLSGDLMLLRERLQEPGARPVTFILLDSQGEAADEDLPFGPLETVWHFDTDLASRHIWPAIDPIASASTLLEGAHLEAGHLAVFQRARRILRRYRELRPLVRAHGLPKLPSAEAQIYHRGERLEQFLSQPFYTAEPYTKTPGAWVGVEETVEDVRRILDGAADDLPVEALKFTGRLQRVE